MSSKWEKHEGILDDEERLEVLDTKDINFKLTLSVWRVGKQWCAGNLGRMVWARTKTKAAAKRLAVSTCLKLCSDAVKSLNQLRPQDAGR